MTRKQLLVHVAIEKAVQYKKEPERLLDDITNGVVGLRELTNLELEEMYLELTGKPLKITS